MSHERCRTLETLNEACIKKEVIKFLFPVSDETAALLKSLTDATLDKEDKNTQMCRLDTIHLALLQSAAQSSEKELVCLFYEDSPGFVEHENIWNTANTRFCT